MSAWTGMALSQDGRSTVRAGTFAFQISRQALEDALQAYSRVTGVEILYESRIAAGLRSSPVNGEFTPELALELLLAETDLVARYAGGNAITLSLPGQASDLPSASPQVDVDLTLDTLDVRGGERPDAHSLRVFSLSVQADIEKALRGDNRTRAGNYRTSVKLWIDPVRTVRRVELGQSTGDAGRDLLIPQILQGLVLRSGPPANTPQPVRIAITVRSL